MSEIKVGAYQAYRISLRQSQLKDGNNVHISIESNHTSLHMEISAEDCRVLSAWLQAEVEMRVRTYEEKVQLEKLLGRY